MVIPICSGQNSEKDEKRSLRGRCGSSWPDTHPADSREIPRAAPWRFSFVGRQFGHESGTCDFREFCRLKAIGDTENKSEAKQTLLVLLFRALFLFFFNI